MSDEQKACVNCGHATPHERGEYEDTHVRCEHETRTCVAGYDCGHKRYSKRCEAASDGTEDRRCYSYPIPCECSSEDREIADLKAALATCPSISEEKIEEMAREIAVALDKDYNLEADERAFILSILRKHLSGEVK